ncbi:26321_t:CDS:2, partial [Gigaspora margarita]
LSPKYLIAAHRFPSTRAKGRGPNLNMSHNMSSETMEEPGHSPYFNSGLTTGQLIVEYLRSLSAYTSKPSILGIHSSVNLSHKDDDDDIPSATTLGNESTSDKIGGYTGLTTSFYGEVV